MNIKVSKIISLPVLIVSYGQKIGEVKDFIIDYKTGKVLAIFLKPRNFFDKSKIIKLEDVKDFGRDAIMILKEDVLKEIDKESKIKKILDSKIKIIGNKVITQRGNYIGEVEDYEIDLTSGLILKFYVKSGILKDLIKGPLIILRDHVVSINKNSIIVRDDIVKDKKIELLKKVKVPKTETAPAMFKVKS